MLNKKIVFSSIDDFVLDEHKHYPCDKKYRFTYT